MSIFDKSTLERFFSKKRTVSSRPIPTWEEIIQQMQSEELHFCSDTVVRVISSRDRVKRIIILRSDNGYYKTRYEEIRVWDADEWNYFVNDESKYPAWWEPVSSQLNGPSFYGTEEDAVKAAAESLEYKSYFA